jgi:hypothetical protein
VAGATITRSSGTSQAPPRELASTGVDGDRLAAALLLFAGGLVVLGLARRARRQQG